MRVRKEIQEMLRQAKSRLTVIALKEKVSSGVETDLSKIKSFHRNSATRL